LERLAREKHSSLLGPFASYEEKKVLRIKTKIFGCHTADSKPVKQEVNGTVILHPLPFPVVSKISHWLEPSWFFGHIRARSEVINGDVSPVTRVGQIFELVK